MWAALSIGIGTPVVVCIRVVEVRERNGADIHSKGHSMHRLGDGIGQYSVEMSSGQCRPGRYSSTWSSAQLDCAGGGHMKNGQYDSSSRRPTSRTHVAGRQQTGRTHEDSCTTREAGCNSPQPSRPHRPDSTHSSLPSCLIQHGAGKDSHQHSHWTERGRQQPTRSNSTHVHTHPRPTSPSAAHPPRSHTVSPTLSLTTHPLTRTRRHTREQHCDTSITPYTTSPLSCTPHLHRSATLRSLIAISLTAVHAFNSIVAAALLVSGHSTVRFLHPALLTGLLCFLSSPR